MSLAGDNHCPVCRAALWAPDDEPITHTTCPRCSAELWALVGLDGPMFFLGRPGQTAANFLASLAAPLYGLSADDLEAGLQNADSLDLVELIMELEEALRVGRTASRER